MNRKNEDRLIELAFGDLRPDEAGRLEAQAAADPSAAKALYEYRELKSGLRDLADVPEHQLSNERLRDAILARGLATQNRPAPAGFRNWAWMPLTACLMAFALVMWRNGPSGAGDPHIVMDESAREYVSSSGPSIQMPESDPTAIEVAPPSSVAATNEATVASTQESVAPKAPAVEPKKASRRSLVASNTRPKAVARERETIMMDAPPIANSRQNDDAIEYTDADDKRPIVLIAQEMDIMTGAQVATEVESASNVLVGG